MILSANRKSTIQISSLNNPCHVRFTMLLKTLILDVCLVRVKLLQLPLRECRVFYFVVDYRWTSSYPFWLQPEFCLPLTSLWSVVQARPSSHRRDGSCNKLVILVDDGLTTLHFTGSYLLARLVGFYGMYAFRCKILLCSFVCKHCVWW